MIADKLLSNTNCQVEQNKCVNLSRPMLNKADALFFSLRERERYISIDLAPS
jgi:hypothetical protein